VDYWEITRRSDFHIYNFDASTKFFQILHDYMKTLLVVPNSNADSERESGRYTMGSGQTCKMIHSVR
jgi:hypothetical protein